VLVAAAAAVVLASIVPATAPITAVIDENGTASRLS
jgi:hypothetical protein